MLKQVEIKATQGYTIVYIKKWLEIASILIGLEIE